VVDELLEALEVTVDGVEEGDRVSKGQSIGLIGDPFGIPRDVVRACYTGVVIGKTNNPLAHMGDALVHIGATRTD